MVCRWGCRTTNRQGRILAVWILAPKLPNSDLKIAVDFWVVFFLLFFPRKRARKNPPKKNHGKIHPGIRSEKFPSDFCRSLLLTNRKILKVTQRLVGPKKRLGGPDFPRFCGETFEIENSMPPSNPPPQKEDEQLTPNLSS